MAFNKEIDNSYVIREIVNLWNPLTERQQKLLSDNVCVYHYKKNDIIYKECDSPENMLCLISGKVKIYKEGISGRNQIMRVVKSFEFFAYRAFFADENYRTTAMAFDDTIIASIPINIVLQLINEAPHISMGFIKQLSKELGNADCRTINLTQKHIRGRLSETLLFLKDSYGVDEDGSTLSVYLSREDIANLSNMTTSNAIRTLSAFADESLIVIDGKKIKIIDDDRLRKISDIG